MKPADTLLVELRSAADALQFDALHARAVEAGAVRLTAKGAATLADMLARAADALEAATTTEPGRA
ncbi:MAG: hypothetical protein L6Q75_19615 [Burkholderiaceae bacterium]|nr:hypothetical protein [Burkholderiaceae bacterium]